MKWTRELSARAVAARARRRMAAAAAVSEEQAWPGVSGPAVRPPRAVPPDFTITIRSKSGERLQISATRFGRRIITGDGVTSARQIARGIEVLLREATP